MHGSPDSAYKLSVLVLPDCYREAVRRWMVDLFRMEAGPCFLGADCWVGNVCYKASEAGLELLPVFVEEEVVFALLKCEKMVAALKMDRDASDQDFIEQICALSSP